MRLGVALGQVAEDIKQLIARLHGEHTKGTAYLVSSSFNLQICRKVVNRDLRKGNQAASNVSGDGVNTSGKHHSHLCPLRGILPGVWTVGHVIRFLLIH